MQVPRIAEEFGNLLAKGDYSAAHALLTKEARMAYSPDDLRRAFEKMTAYEPGPIQQVLLNEDFALGEWPEMQNGDIASVYVGLIGESYVEAVTVVVAEESGAHRIRHLGWGRP